MIKKGDIILIVAVSAMVIAGIIGFNFYKNTHKDVKKIAVIKKDNKVIRTIDIDNVENPERITVEGKYTNIILVEKGRIRFENADCPDLVCVKTGWLSEKGDLAVCLPNQAIIKIEGETEEVDGITY
ncbi:MAG TPA: NusG domain II-containing protein [Clostridiaceae bacterium]|nr:NusG domain II-containing protein [Clostridiaceae bacterium]